jgi:hypothetical protein
MDDTIYAKLIDGICELGKAAPSRERYERCDLAVEGTLFTLIPARDGNGEINAVAYFADVGPLPEKNREVAAIELLEANLFMIGQDAPCFCCNPESGHVLMVGRMPLHAVNPESALQLLSGVAHFAFSWRESQHEPAQGSRQAAQPGRKASPIIHQKQSQRVPK